MVPPFAAAAATGVSMNFCCCCSWKEDDRAMSLEDRLGLSVGTARSAASEVAAEVAAAAAVSDLRFWLMRSACHMLFLRRRFSLFAGLMSSHLTGYVKLNFKHNRVQLTGRANKMINS